MTRAPQDKTVAVNGLKFHYLDWGTRGKTPMLLLHGLSQTAHSWDEVAPALSEDFHVYAPDARGHGDTDWAPDKEYGWETHQRDVEELVQAFGMERLVVMGLSMGGRNAIIYTANHPEKVAALVAVDVGPDSMRAGVENIFQFIRGPDELDLEEFVERAHRFNSRRTIENIRSRMLVNLRQLPSGKWTWKYDKVFRDPNFLAGRGSRELDLWELVARIQCPTLVIRGGESDVLSEETAQKMTRVMRACRTATVPGAGHSVMGDNPSGFLQAVSAFFAQAFAGKVQGR